MSFVLPIQLRLPVTDLPSSGCCQAYFISGCHRAQRAASYGVDRRAVRLPCCPYSRTCPMHAPVLFFYHIREAYSAYALLFGIVAVLLSTKTSTVIYGLPADSCARPAPAGPVHARGRGRASAAWGRSTARATLCSGGPRRSRSCRPSGRGEMDLARFEREVQMTSQLTSPHAVSFYDSGQHPGRALLLRHGVS